MRPTSLLLAFISSLTLSRAAGARSNNFEHYLDSSWLPHDPVWSHEDGAFHHLSIQDPAIALADASSSLDDMHNYGAFYQHRPMYHDSPYGSSSTTMQGPIYGAIHPRGPQQSFHDYLFSSGDIPQGGGRIAQQQVDRPATPPSRLPTAGRRAKGKNKARGGRKGASSSLNDQEAQIREEGEGEDGGVENEEFSGASAAASVLSPEKLEDLRVHLISLWHRKGLWVGMDTRELAVGMTEIRIETGLERSHTTGRLLANHIKLEDESVSEEYLKDVRAWTKKLNMKLRRLNERCDRARPPLSDQERIDDTLKYIRFLKTRSEYLYMVRSNIGRRKDEKKEEERVSIKKEAQMIWVTLLQEAPLKKSKRKVYIDLEEVARESRYLSVLLEPYTMDEVADYIRFYLANDLGMTHAQIDVFNRARNQWLQACHEQRQKQDDEEQAE